MAKQKTKKKKITSLPTNWTPIPVALVILALGACFIAFSAVIEYLALAVGIFVILGAIVFFVVTMLGKSRRAVFALQIIFSICVLATGIITIVFNEHSAGIICMVFSGAVAVDGSMKLGTALQSKQYSIRGKSVAIPLSVITIVSALAMVRYTPSEITDENIKTCSVIIGITFILDAIGNFIVPFLRRGINKRIANTFTEQYEPSEESEEAPSSEVETDATDAENTSADQTEEPISTDTDEKDESVKTEEPTSADTDEKDEPVKTEDEPSVDDISLPEDIAEENDVWDDAKVKEDGESATDSEDDPKTKSE